MVREARDFICRNWGEEMANRKLVRTKQRKRAKDYLSIQQAHTQQVPVGGMRYWLCALDDFTV